MLQSYRNQPIDFQYKSVDWFLYECNKVWYVLKEPSEWVT